VTVSELRFWDEGLLHPVTKTKTEKLHTSPKQACAMGEIRMNRLVSWKIRTSQPGEKGHFKGANGRPHARDTWDRLRNFFVSWSYYPRLSRFATITPIRHYVSF